MFCNFDIRPRGAHSEKQPSENQFLYSSFLFEIFFSALHSFFMRTDHILGELGIRNMCAYFVSRVDLYLKTLVKTCSDKNVAPIYLYLWPALLLCLLHLIRHGFFLVLSTFMNASLITCWIKGMHVGFSVLSICPSSDKARSHLSLRVVPEHKWWTDRIIVTKSKAISRRT